MPKKRADWDDGRVVAPMNGDEQPTYRKFFLHRRRKNDNSAAKDPALDISRKERRAMTRAFFGLLLPRLVVVFAAFGLVILLTYLWFG